MAIQGNTEDHLAEVTPGSSSAASSLLDILKAIADANRQLRSAIRRFLRRLLVGVACLAVITFIAVALRSRVATAVIGYVVTLFLLSLFAFFHLLAKGLGHIELKTPTLVLRLPISVGFGALVFVRFIILFAAEWTVDFYVSLCSGGIHAFLTWMNKNVAFSLLVLAIALWNLGSEGKSKSIRLASRAMATYGYFFFLASICSLSLAMLASDAFRASIRIFEWPPWFLAIETQAYVHAGLHRSGLISWPSLLVIVPLVVGVVGTSRSGEPREDVTHLILALTAFLSLVFLAYAA